jgi:hypothetical protein
MDLGEPRRVIDRRREKSQRTIAPLPIEVEAVGQR